MQILVRFPDKAAEQRALGKLIPRFSGKSWANAELMLLPAALGYLASEGIPFTVLGPAPYERATPRRDPGSVAV